MSTQHTPTGIRLTRTAGDWQARHLPTGLARQGRTRAIAMARIRAAIAAHPDYRAALKAATEQS